MFVNGKQRNDYGSDLCSNGHEYLSSDGNKA